MTIRIRSSDSSGSSLSRDTANHWAHRVAHKKYNLFGRGQTSDTVKKHPPVPAVINAQSNAV
jgi:hypothetical protein